MTTIHPFDEATALTALGDGRFTGRTSPAYANMAGPFGGVTAATLLRAALAHPERRGDPVALTANFCAAIATGDFEVEARLLRGGKSTQHWQVELRQEGIGVAASALIICGEPRQTWSHRPVSAPAAPPAEAVEAWSMPGLPAWIGAYDFRFVTGAPNWRGKSGDAPQSAQSLLWLRDAPPRPLDHLSLAALSDAFFIRLFQVRGSMVPVGTVTLSTYFFADEASLARQGDRPLLGTADAKIFSGGFFDQTAELWADDGKLLATSTQVVWYKE